VPSSTQNELKINLHDLGFHCKVYENCALLGYYAVSGGNFVPMFWDNLSYGFLITEQGTDSLARNVCKKLPLLAT
jgi:hypothetical protein